MDIQSLYQRAIKFATLKHVEQDQKVPDTNLPYVVHLSNVAMEILIAGSHSPNFDLPFAVQVALLHDTLEDTNTTFDELTGMFGENIAMAVQALTKDIKLPKEQRMQDCLVGIKKLQPEVWAIKMADRITNLQPPPPSWDLAKRDKYREEAIVILAELKDGNEYLAKRLELKIEEYVNF
jgi:guanosine-3',5'-bis(diphosphate) 3'-pyrophosphohydrolase